jgi:riboflavin biosynthesis pyrimidine reductase
MRQLHPATEAEVDPVEVYGRLSRLAPDRPSVRLNMIASVDGAAALAGRSGALGGGADKALFVTLRSLADVVLVGAPTMRTEGYGPARLDPPARRRRESWGLTAVPAMAVVTRSCRLDWRVLFFTQAEQRPVVLTTGAARPADRAAAASVADVVLAGDASVDLSRAFGVLAERGAENVLVEGGPDVNGQLAAAGLLDEVCLTISPVLVAGGAGRIARGADLAVPTTLELATVLEADGYLFLRYRRR